MEFLNKLVETNDSIVIRENPQFFVGDYEDYGFRQFKAVIINERIHLSIQASYGHYCSPRQTLDIEEYETMELAIFKDGEFVNAFEVINEGSIIRKLEECYDGMVYGFVPIELIEELYQELIKRG